MPKLKTQEQFIQEAKSIHRDRYDYSKVIYAGSHQRVKIGCVVHGEFEQKAYHHLQGKGCIACAGKSQKSTKQFVQEAIQKHGDKYDYSQTEYIRRHSRLKVICKIHGNFWQLASVHLSGGGCPDCSPTGLDYSVETMLYLVLFEKNCIDFWKVGITNTSIKKRYVGEHHFITKEYKWMLPDGWFARKIECAITSKWNNHLMIANDRLLKRNGDSECFNTSLPVKDVIKFINSQTQA